LHLQLNPDVILAGAQTGALTARGVTRTIPIVTIILEDPVVSGFASSIAKPGGNIQAGGDIPHCSEPMTLSAPIR
jgi:putative ABC transport system substrate-binding protein